MAFVMDDRCSTPSFFCGGQLSWPAISQGHLLSDSIIVGFPSTTRSAIPNNGGKEKNSSVLGQGRLTRINVNPIQFHKF